MDNICCFNEPFLLKSIFLGKPNEKFYRNFLDFWLSSCKFISNDWNSVFSSWQRTLMSLLCFSKTLLRLNIQRTKTRLILNTYWTKQRTTYNILMLSSLMLDHPKPCFWLRGKTILNLLDVLRVIMVIATTKLRAIKDI